MKSNLMNMKGLRLLLLGNLVLVVGVAAGLEAADVTQYRAKPGRSKMVLEGTSNVHDWVIEGLIIGGTVQAGPGFTTDLEEAKPGEVDLKAEVFLPVRSLKSMKDGKAYDVKMDEAMYEEMKMAEHPQIRYKLGQLVLKKVPENSDAAFLLESEGELTIAGVSREISIPIEMKSPDENTLSFSGQTTIKMSDFGVGPVARLGGLFKAGDEVKVSFDWTVGKR
jgi:hypothetical protein